MMREVLKFLRYPFYFLGVVALILVGLGLSVTLPGEELTPAGVSRYSSQYVKMRDGVEIAVDVWLPADYKIGQKLPTLIHATRYGRAYRVRFPYRIMMALGQAGPLNYKPQTHTVNEDGYVMVKIDARGTGASNGERPYDLLDDELLDYGEVIDWVSKQSWSNGKVGAFGRSYPGMAAEMMAISKHPALIAVAPQYTYYDTYQNLSHPGGVYDRYFMEGWSENTEGMDRGTCFRASTWLQCWLYKLMSGGIRPVDGPDAERKLAKAHSSRNNPTVLENLAGFEYRDDPFGSENGNLTAPYQKMQEITESGVAMNVWVGWHDSGTVDGAISRFKTLPNKQHLIIGPYTHAGMHDTNPFSEPDTPVSPDRTEQIHMLMRFFDPFLKGEKKPDDGEHKIEYFTFGDDAYRTTKVWPPEGIATQRWVFGEGNSLNASSSDLSEDEAFDTYAVDFSATSGTRTRWHTIGGPDVVYPDRREEDKKLLTYTSAPLLSALEITGPPQVTLNLASTHEDGALHVYLEAVAPDGRVTYLTEGVLSLRHRAVSDNPPYIVDTVYHSSKRGDAKPMMPGIAEEVIVPLFNTSVVIKKGHKIRIAIAGADKDTFARVPTEGDPTLTVYRSVAQPSFVDLPQRWRK